MQPNAQISLTKEGFIGIFRVTEARFKNNFSIFPEDGIVE